MASPSAAESVLRSRVARLVQLVIGVPAAITGVVLLVLAAVLHHDYQIAAIALGELGAVLLSLSILHLLYERLLREEYNRETVHILKDQVYPMFEAFAPLATAREMGISEIKLEPELGEFVRWIRTRTTRSLNIVGVWLGYQETFQQLWVDMANRGQTVDFYMSIDEFIVGRRLEDIMGEKNLGAETIENSKRSFSAMLNWVRPEHRDKLRLWGYRNLPNLLMAQADEGPLIVAPYMLRKQAPETFLFEIADGRSPAGRLFGEQIQLVKQQAERLM